MPGTNRVLLTPFRLLLWFQQKPHRMGRNRVLGWGCSGVGERRRKGSLGGGATTSKPSLLCKNFHLPIGAVRFPIRASKCIPRPLPGDLLSGEGYKHQRAEAILSSCCIPEIAMCYGSSVMAAMSGDNLLNLLTSGSYLLTVSLLSKSKTANRRHAT